MQYYLKEAAHAGDTSAIELYKAAAYELYLSVKSVYDTLSFSPDTKTKVSYSGGLFFDGNFIIKPLSRLIEQLSVELVSPALPPVCGDILLAMQNITLSRAKNLYPILKTEYQIQKEE